MELRRQWTMLGLILVALSFRPLTAQIAAIPRGFEWRQSVPLHLLQRAQVAQDLVLSPEAVEKLRQLDAQTRTEAITELLSRVCRELKIGPAVFRKATPLIVVLYTTI